LAREFGGLSLSTCRSNSSRGIVLGAPHLFHVHDGAGSRLAAQPLPPAVDDAETWICVRENYLGAARILFWLAGRNYPVLPDPGRGASFLRNLCGNWPRAIKHTQKAKLPTGVGFAR
jgi:hypothetical protein